MDTAQYEQLDAHRCRVSGARWEPAKQFTVKIEGAAKVGERALMLAGCADPRAIAAMKEILPAVEKTVRELTAKTVKEKFDVYHRVYGIDGVFIGPGDLGWMSLLAGIAALPIPFITGSWMDKWGRKRIIVPSFVLLAIALTFVSATAFLQWSLELYVLGYVLAQMAQGTTNGTMQVLGTDMAPSFARGRFFAIWRMVAQLAATITPAIRITREIFISPGILLPNGSSPLRSITHRPHRADGP